MSVVGIALLILVLSLAAGLAPQVVGASLGERALTDVTAISAGLLLASALLLVIPEGFHVGEAHDLEPIVLGAVVLAGFVLMLFLEGIGIGHAVHEEHHSHVEGHGHGHVHHPTSIWTAAVGLTVHAVADGLAVGASVVAGEPAFSVLVAVAVILHRVPVAFSLGMFSLHESRSRSTQIAGICIFSVATPIAAIAVAQLLGEGDSQWVAWALLLSAGTFLYVATVDVLPRVHNPETGRRSALMVVGGAVLLLAILVVASRFGLLEHGH